MTVLMVNNDSSVRNLRGFSYSCMCRKRSRVILFVAYKNDCMNSSPLFSFKQIKMRRVLAAFWWWEWKGGGCRNLEIRKKLLSVKIWSIILSQGVSPSIINSRVALGFTVTNVYINEFPDNNACWFLSFGINNGHTIEYLTRVREHKINIRSSANINIHIHFTETGGKKGRKTD